MPAFSVLILTIGIPGAGKTTWVNTYKKTHPRAFIISTDEIRKDLTGSIACDPNQNDMIHEEARKQVKNLIEHPLVNGTLGPEIIVDSTNVDVQEWLKYKDLKPSVILAKVFNVEPEEAMKRQQVRGRIVPQEILDQKWKTLQQNKKYMPYIFNMILDD